MTDTFTTYELQAAYRRGELTPQQYCEATRIPLKDAFLWLYENGERRLALVADIYVPAFARTHE